MRPLKLTLRSFGPFAGEEKVDFTRYGENAFLLINGPTGAGKTSILDGICYALYGEASGANRNEHYLRSQQSAPEAICEVEFLFSVGPRTFLIKRRPTQSFLQKGVQRETMHKVEFCQVDNNGTVTGDHLTKIGEVRDKIEEVIGFSSEQFRQVVVLPQGEFRRLLLAKSDEKERILEKLFGTERYKLVEESLKRKKATIGSELKELRSGVEGILSANDVATTQELEERIAGLVLQLAKIEVELKQQTVRQVEAQSLFMDAQALESCFLEQDKAVKELAALHEKKPGVDQVAKRVDLATRALNLVDLEESIVRTEVERSNCSQTITALIERIGTLSGQRQLAKDSSDKAHQDNDKVTSLIAEKTRLEGQLVKLKELAASRTRETTALKSEAAARKAVDTHKIACAKAEKRSTELSVEIETLSLTAGSVEQLESEMTRLQNLYTTRELFDSELKNLIEISTQFTAKSMELKTVEDSLAAAREHQNKLQQDFIAGQASILAARLEDGHPCPVCGSGDHPHPAQVGANIPTEKEIDKILKQISDLEKQMQKVSKEHSKLLSQKSAMEGAISQRLESLGDAVNVPPTEMLSLLDDIKDRQIFANTNVVKLEACKKERVDLASKQTEMKELLEKAEQEHSAARADLEGVRALVEQAQKDAGDSDEKTVASRIDDIAGFVLRTAAALKKAEKELLTFDGQLQVAGGERIQLEQQLEQLTNRHAELETSFTARLDKEGFSSAKAYHEAKLPIEEIKKLNLDVEAFREKLASAVTHCERSKMACKDKSRPDLESVRVAKEQVDALVGDLQKKIGVLTGQHSGLADALRTIGEKGSRMAVMEQEYSVTARLADLVGGSNPLRMTLQRYVLAALFEEVTIAASQRLSRMSRGRYHLVRSETPRDGKTTGGLDLDVTDDYIGEKRPAFTLSGGESFLASLSLALGLSDVVMAQQGGRYLDCIFIDEGFGSLDGETLDFALNTLIELHRTGRVIGIISHVGELKERIQSRIDVIASKDGSKIVQESI